MQTATTMTSKLFFSFCRIKPVITNVIHKRGYASSVQLTNTDVRRKRNEIFGREKARQLALVDRVEKIQVDYLGTEDDSCTLLMNKGLSTPFNCAMHIKELLLQRSVLAVVNDVPWDMHKPLIKDCKLKFIHFKDHDPSLANLTFWRSCSFILGHVLETAFKDEFYVELCSFPPPKVESGSFVYDADIKMTDWTPSSRERSCLSRIASKLKSSDLKFERLEMDASIAQEMFEDNRFKSAQIPSIAARSESGSLVTVYRMGDHVDITQGPLISSTTFINRFNVTAIHPIDSPEFGRLQRVQGVAMPVQLPIHYWAYDRLMDRASKKNPAPAPRLIAPKSPKVSNLLNS